MYHYRFCGLNVASELVLPEVDKLAGGDVRCVPPPDVEIREGHVPHELPGPVTMTGEYMVGRQTVLLIIPGVARYHIADGRRITIHLIRGADLGSVRIYLLGSALAAILHQRAVIPLHACAIEFKGRCVAFLGNSGAGKSTLAGLLALRGHVLLSDDILALQRGAERRYLAAPGIPSIKMWPDSAEQVNLASDPPLEAPDHRKFRILMSSYFGSELRPLRRLYALKWLLPRSATVEIEALRPFDAIGALRSNIYRDELLQPMGMNSYLMEFMGEIISSASFFALRRPMDFARTSEILDAIEAHLEQP